MSDTAVPILMYHAVASAPNDATRALSVAPEAFAEQMALIGDLGLTPVTTADLAARWRSGRPLPDRPVLITFDDGYEGVHRHALPVLAKHGFPATLFVSTGWIKGAYDTGGGLDAMLDWQQVRDLADSGIEIGGHSHSHPQLDQLDDATLRSELVRSTEIVTGELGARPVSFAYPYGYSSRRVRGAVREAGYAQALAVGNGLARRRQGPYALQRVTVRRGTDVEEFERLLQGRAITRNFAKDRALTKGYALVRRARQVRRKAIRSRV
ncbi:polysaccharide deacetylase family protein [Streptomyces sp. Ag109_G2-15]|uniref:polysaccharide deacetylase family protein n=1 Tax=Streptomyces sp. Ag109_G2-15 TaxID=1938850 RepID=UPI000BC7D0FB|nr:polysaccharide deacetylase family protein [Streptomyces sp. Ag109_G2-15]SOD87678.1 Polysaccharide deacetylase [Streptomyces sp. Ag109_G2-15]